MRQFFGSLILLVIIFSISSNAQNVEKDFVLSDINRKVNEYPNQFDLSTPLNSFLTFKYLQVDGKQGLYQSVNTYRFRGVFAKPNSPNIEVSNEKKEKLLNTKIRRVIIFKDSIAGIITDYSEPMCIITYLSFEDGKWLNAGEDLGNDLNDAVNVFKKKCSNFLNYVYRIKELKSESTDTTAFTNYLKNNGKVPKDFILDALSNHKIVIYGEIHRRKSSWDLMKSVITNSTFASKVGTIFMEVSSDKQNELDKFIANEELDVEIIQNIFRDLQINGWYDKGMYEFLIEIWKLNKTLPKEKRVNLVCVDEPRPFGLFKNYEEMKTHFNSILDRNEQMAKIISETISNNKDKRNSLFIVGNGHAFKSQVPGFGVDRRKNEAKPTAAAQLTKIFAPDEVFSIFQHCPVISNDGKIRGLIRNGIFDSVFAKVGNKQIAFELKDSPFGKEPFDGLYEITYDNETGNFENNYDAYLFLGQLESENEEYLFYDILTDEYVKELERRAKMTNSSVEKWFGITEVTKEAIIEKLKSSSQNKKRWMNL
ncbi:MAG: hypothetical protein M0P71_09280 [Melioribacteraceae bacterium]|nr:hypothetical protein [Melioribacteraceae bacterium]